MILEDNDGESFFAAGSFESRSLEIRLNGPAFVFTSPELPGQRVMCV